ncbi:MULTISPECIES: hypothetical protein [unclassified Nitrobacter]|uniref:hypothetical protein n=1 Tax=unclassified Nitrobacter TaxID=2620411 RepID=UPI00092C975B|nr:MULTISPECIES: hypothetical protein [unclassified Nitrobacter]MBN9149765.1 hypothetical protein [Nitrobacter sp.]OJV03274.1 MAG: hypothetical protein BGO16_10165 [Nitrobacter sp. 62-23]
MIAIVACLFLIGSHHCDLDAGRPTGDDWPATFGEDFFDFRGAKPALPAVEKSRRAGVAGSRSRRRLRRWSSVRPTAIENANATPIQEIARNLTTAIVSHLPELRECTAFADDAPWPDCQDKLHVARARGRDLVPVSSAMLPLGRCWKTAEVILCNPPRH